MKRIILLSLLAGFGLATFAQRGPATNLTSIINPATSEGYAAWGENTDPDLEFKVDVLYDGRVMNSFTTANNYCQFDLVENEGHDYRVSLVNIGTGEVVATGPEDHIRGVPQDHIPKKNTCTKVCVGATYAWEMSLVQDDVPSWSITDAGFLRLDNTYDYFDNVAGTVVPYYQAMSPSHFNLHPEYITENYIYHSTNVGSSPNPPVVDAYGTPLTGTVYFVEKRMEQYAWADWNRTTEFNPPSSICSQTLTGSGGWIDRFNSYPHPDNSQPNTQIGDDPTLKCQTGPGNPVGGNGGVGVNGNWPAINHGHMVFNDDKPTDPINDPIWYSFELLDLAITTGIDQGSPIDHVEFEPLTGRGTRFEVDLSGGAGTSTGVLEEGLYRTYLVFKNGFAMSSYVVADPGAASTADTDFNVGPNPGSGLFSVRFHNPLDNGVLTVRRSNGQVVFTRNLAPGATVESVDLTREPNSLYFIQVQSPNAVTQKIVQKQ